MLKCMCRSVPLVFLFDTRLYLREKTVRRLNRQRPAEKRLHFRTKYALARQMLVELEQLFAQRSCGIRGI